ncbi:hypothetical protein HRJ45_06170 [Vibrio coralliilyticus]|uniref:hypothetical protein n=1 Tax=Vibrio coralliilyticus TaxID=190893 RepID=UPI0015600D92|nr:hypothetical protein [Vibrio coralliilyticus]NRF24799.1 hypothetical protein [Vibrio coralliilyticus]NRF78679.1 hypothetical protein [Vibrio coralliilyticus]
MDVKHVFPDEKCKVSDDSVIVFSNSIFGGVRINRTESGYVVCSSSEVKSISLILMILSILIMFFIVRLDMPLFYVTIILGAAIQLLSIVITEVRILYIKTRIYTYYGKVNDN